MHSHQNPNILVSYKNREIVLLVLGVLLFMVSLGVFLRYIVRGGSLCSLPVCFVVSITMIGFPSVRSIQYKEGVLTSQMTTDRWERNHTDTPLPEKLQAKVARLGARLQYAE